MQEIYSAATPNGPKLDETRTQYALRILPPVIDGEINVLNPDEWRFAAGNSDYWHVFPDSVAGLAADGIRGGAMGGGTPPADLDDLSFKIFAGFDTNYLYVAVRVRDSVIQTDSAAADLANGNTWEDDSVEVFVDGANANNPTWVAGQIGGQFVISANNAYRQAEAGNPGFGPNAAWYAKTTPLADGSGYEAEFRISLAILGNPKPGDVLGFTVAVNDDDDGGPRERQVVWVGTVHRPATYGNLVLGAQSYNAVRVTTPPNPDGKINASEYSGAAEIRVNAKIGVVYVPGGDDDLPVTDLEYKAYVVHDNDAVYIAVDITDEKVSTDQSDVAQMPDLPTWEDDSVEIFFDLDNSKNFGGGTALGGGVFEGQYTQTHKGFYYHGSPSVDAQKGVHWFGMGSLTPTGYQVEFKIPKSSLGNPKDNAPIGFHLAINDDDAVGDYSHIGWTGQAHHEYTYGTLTLAGPSTPATPLRIVSAKPDLAAGSVTLQWEGGDPQFQVEKASTVTGPFQAVGAAQSARVFTDAGVLKAGVQSFYRIRQGAVAGPTPVPAGCSTASVPETWVNSAFTNQTGAFSVQFEATPSAARMDSVMALSSGPRTAFSGFACLTRFNVDGNIDARNAGVYAADNVIPYSANVTYTFRLVVNVPAHTYSVYVTPAGGTEQTVGLNYAFRSDQSTVTNLNYWGVVITASGAAGTNTVCNFKLLP